MNKPYRHPNHILSSTSRKYLEKLLPDEWIYNIPDHDYGLDYHIEIVQNGQVTGLNFSIQLKSTKTNSNSEAAKAILKLSTLRYFAVRLEPIMIVQYEADTQEAYWTWINDLTIDLTKPIKTHTISIQKSKKLKDINWGEVVEYVQTIFNRKSMINDFDISNLHDNFEIAAWNAYYKKKFDQAIYLFKEVEQNKELSKQAKQALVWSLYNTYKYVDALNLVNNLLLTLQSESIYQMKACILAELGFSEGDEGKIILARNLFFKYLNEDASAYLFYNYANTLSGLGEFNNAIVNFKISLSKDPNSAECWKNLAHAYYSIKDHDQELKCYDAALSLNPNLPEALFSKAVTLAQIYQRYGDAIEIFTKVLNPEKPIQKNMVNGLFWIALSYEKINQLDTALFWIDRGLEFDSRNQYLLGLKFDLLIRNWKTDVRLKQIAEEFLVYQIDLDKDPRSIRALIEIRSMASADALQFISEHIIMYRNVNRDELDKASLSFINVLDSLDYNRTYLEFRKEFPLSRYVGHFISGAFSIETIFWDLLDITFCLVFNKSIEIYKEARDEVGFRNQAFNLVAERLPNLIPTLCASIADATQDELDEICLVIYKGLTTIAYREIGSQSGYLSRILNLRVVDPSEYLSDQGVTSLDENIVQALTRYIENYFNP